jgi:hypothetical protein
MTNVTLAFDELTLKKGRERAKQKGSSFNAYVRELVKRDIEPETDLAKEMFVFMEEHPPQFPDAKWTREEIHERGGR